MERIIYRITLDLHKTGIQRTLQGFETADNMSRSIAVNLTASGDTYEIPLDNVVAMMYVTTPGASEPSINECRIEDNTIIYDVLPIVEEGITEMQLKLIQASLEGAKKVLIAPRFAVEVTESGTEDDGAEQTTTFSALENAIARANGVYDARLLRIEIDKDCTFRAVYADGTIYENDALNEALYNGNALLSESWAKGGTGIREGEETNNSKYFSNVSKSSSIEASASADMVRGLVDMAKLHSTYTSFDTNFKTGELEYISASHNFDVNEETGELEVEGELFDPTDVLEKVADDYLDEKTQEISKNTEDIDSVEKEVTQLKSDLAKLESEVADLPDNEELINNETLINNVVERVPFVKTAEPPTFVDSVEEMTDTSMAYVLKTDWYLYRHEKQENYNLFKMSEVSYSSRLQDDAEGIISSTPQNLVTGWIPVSYGKYYTFSALYNGNRVASGDGTTKFFTRINTKKADGSIGLNEDGIYILTDLSKSTIKIESTDVTEIQAQLAFAKFGSADVSTAEKLSVFQIMIVEGDTADEAYNNAINLPYLDGDAEATAKWVSTGLAYQPMDYEDRIIALEEKTTKLDNCITEPNSASPYYRNVNFGCLPYGYFRGLDNSYSVEGFTGDTQYADYIAKFKALMVGHEAYVTETNLGNASDGQAIYLYDFKPVRWDNEVKAIPKIIIVAGQHGAEKCNVFGLYYFVKDLLNNWFNSPQLEYLRHHVELMIVPVTNPYGFDNFINTNANGVNINRNYSSNWVLFDDTTSLQYGGAEPFDQPESQIIRDFVLNNNDCVMLIDSHTNSTVPATSWDQLGYYGIDEVDDNYFNRLRDALPELVSKISPNFNIDYNLNAPDTRFGFLTNAAGGNGNLRTWATDNNVLCVLIEGFSGFVGDTSPATPNVFKANEEQMVNWLITAMNYLSK